MSENLKEDIEIIPPTETKTIREAAQAVWNGARARFDAAHRAAARHLDRMSEVSTMDSMTMENPAAPTDRSAQKGRQSVVSRMENRALLLADALQRHALVNIIDTRIALDDIARAAAQGERVDERKAEQDR